MKNLDKAHQAVEERGLNPKQMAFLEAYYSPYSETYANAYRSALYAGYKETYARLIYGKNKDTWISLDNYADKTQMTPEHVITSIERIALKGGMDKDKLSALKLLAELKGMVVEKKLVGHVNIEQALSELR